MYLYNNNNNKSKRFRFHGWKMRYILIEWRHFHSKRMLCKSEKFLVYKKYSTYYINKKWNMKEIIGFVNKLKKICIR